MSRRKRRPRHASHERWLVSYADFITLLFAFFVVMYSSAQVDQRKVGKLAMAIQTAFTDLGVFQSQGGLPAGSQTPNAFGAVRAMENEARLPDQSDPSVGREKESEKSDAGNPADSEDLTPLRAELEKTLLPEIERRELALRTAPDGLVVSLREIGFFDSGSAKVKAASQDTFARIAVLLLQHAHRVRIEGHTDNIPIHTTLFASNWELSTARATEVVRLLIVKYGFSPDRLSAAGYAEYHPVASNKTAEGRQQNRRVDIVILGKQKGAPKRTLQDILPAAGQAKPSPAIDSLTPGR